jgi:hypothetical protein
MPLQSVLRRQSQSVGIVNALFWHELCERTAEVDRVRMPVHARRRFRAQPLRSGGPPFRGRVLLPRSADGRVARAGASAPAGPELPERRAPQFATGGHKQFHCREGSSNASSSVFSLAVSGRCAGKDALGLKRAETSAHNCWWFPPTSRWAGVHRGPSRRLHGAESGPAPCCERVPTQTVTRPSTLGSRPRHPWTRNRDARFVLGRQMALADCSNSPAHPRPMAIRRSAAQRAPSVRHHARGCLARRRRRASAARAWRTS